MTNETVVGFSGRVFPLVSSAAHSDIGHWALVIPRSFPLIRRGAALYSRPF
jgi:hypothetical protein